MISMLQKIASAAKNRTTYRVGLLQARAYRTLKQETTKILKPFGISTVEWAFLGLLYDNKEMRMKDAAEELGVEAPFITAMISRLDTLGLVVEVRPKEDSRVKLISLTPKGREFVPTTESKVRSSIGHLIAGVHPRDLLGYLTTIETIIKNKR